MGGVSRVRDLACCLSSGHLGSIALVSAPNVSTIMNGGNSTRRRRARLCLNLEGHRGRRAVRLSGGTSTIILLLNRIACRNSISFVSDFLGGEKAGSDVGAVNILSRVSLDSREVRGHVGGSGRECGELSGCIGYMIPVSTKLGCCLPSRGSYRMVGGILSEVPSGRLLSSVMLEDPRSCFDRILPNVRVALSSEGEVCPRNVPFEYFSIVTGLLCRGRVASTVGGVGRVSNVSCLVRVLSSCFFGEDHRVGTRDSVRHTLLVI